MSETPTAVTFAPPGSVEDEPVTEPIAVVADEEADAAHEDAYGDGFDRADVEPEEAPAPAPARKPRAPRGELSDEMIRVLRTLLIRPGEPPAGTRDATMTSLRRRKLVTAEHRLTLAGVEAARKIEREILARARLLARSRRGPR